MMVPLSFVSLVALTQMTFRVPCQSTSFVVESQEKHTIRHME